MEDSDRDSTECANATRSGERLIVRTGRSEPLVHNSLDIGKSLVRVVMESDYPPNV